MTKLSSLVGGVLGRVKEIAIHLSEYPLIQNLPVDEKTKKQWEKFLASYDWKEEALKYLLWRLEQDRKHERRDV